MKAKESKTMKVKFRSEPSAEYQKVALEIEYDIPATTDKEQEAMIKILQAKTNDLAMSMLDDLMVKKDKYMEEREWEDPLEEKPIPEPKPRQQTEAPKAKNIGALWEQDGILKGTINGNKITVGGDTAENIKAIKAMGFCQAYIGSNNVRVIRNKYKLAPKHPDYVLFPVTGDEQ